MLGVITSFLDDVRDFNNLRRTCKKMASFCGEYKILIYKVEYVVKKYKNPWNQPTGHLNFSRANMAICIDKNEFGNVMKGQDNIKVEEHKSEITFSL
jgi:hypothetical protein